MDLFRAFLRRFSTYWWFLHILGENLKSTRKFDLIFSAAGQEGCKLWERDNFSLLWTYSSLDDWYSQLSVNRHLFKTDTFCWSRPFFSQFTVTKLLLRGGHLCETYNGHFKTSTDTCEVEFLVNNALKRKCTC